MNYNLDDKKKENELIKQKYAKRVYVKTIEGADLAISYFFDEFDKYTTEQNAKKIIIRELTYERKLMKESIYFIKSNSNNE